MLKERMFAVLCVFLFVTALCGCEKMDGKYGATAVGVKAAGLTTSDISQITVTVTGPNITGEITQVLSGNPETGWSGLVEDIPAGDDRVFHAYAYDADNNVIYNGEAVGVTIVDGETAQVVIYLQQYAPPDPFTNSVPRFESVVISSNQVAPNHSIDLVAYATDPDDDPLTYAWSATGGTFDDDTSASTTWTAPAITGVYTLTVSATDPYASVATVNFDIDVEIYYADGDAEVSINVNTWPVVQGLVPTPTSMAVGDSIDLDLTASDPDGDTLQYSWSANCTGTFDDATAEDPAFTLTADNYGEDCTLTATITDGRGGTNTASIGVQTIAEPEVRFLEVFDNAPDYSDNWTEMPDPAEATVEYTTGNFRILADSAGSGQSAYYISNEAFDGDEQIFEVELYHGGYGRTTFAVYQKDTDGNLFSGGPVADFELDTNDCNFLSMGGYDMSPSLWTYEGTPYMDRWLTLKIAIDHRRMTFWVAGYLMDETTLSQDIHDTYVYFGAGSAPWKSGPNDTSFRKVEVWTSETVVEEGQ